LYNGSQWLQQAQAFQGDRPRTSSWHSQSLQWEHNSLHIDRYPNQWFYDNEQCIQGDDWSNSFLTPPNAITTADETPPLPELYPEPEWIEDVEASEERCEVQDTTAFPHNFFANSFAVSFPGDIPCPGAPMALGSFLFESDTNTTASSLPPTVKLPPHLHQPAQHTPPTAPLSSPAEASPPAQDFQFIDMTDKKAAMRIRNTRISRQHRANKVKRIADLEKRLEAALLEIHSLKQRTAGPGPGAGP
jgi:hypothetical protein